MASRQRKIKTCTACGLEKPHAAGGLCTTCYMSTPERRAETRKRAVASYYADQPARYAVAKARRSNPEKLAAINEVRRAHYRKNRERFISAVAEYQRNNPEKVVVRQERRRARKLHAEGQHSFDDWMSRLAEFNYACAYCLRRIPNSLEQEHMTPLSSGGDNSISNIVPACRSCNASKGARTHVMWLRMTAGRERNVNAL